jgi:hypothetical protein
LQLAAYSSAYLDWNGASNFVGDNQQFRNPRMVVG